MKTFFTIAALAAAAQAYSAHTGKDEIDQTNSTKTHGLVLWENFFDEYFKTFTPTDLTSADGYNVNLHACYFHFEVGQWASTHANDRYHLAVTQNCKDTLITKFVMTLTFDAGCTTDCAKPTDIDHIIASGTMDSTGTKSLAGITDFHVLKYAASDDTESAAVWLWETTAPSKWGYSYTIDFA